MIRLMFLLTWFACSAPALAQPKLAYTPAPADNPLKGLVPYAQPHADRFPHSMEFNYLPLSDILVGPDRYNWKPLEDLLNDIASRRKQTIFRIWMEYPGRTEGIPAYLEQSGVKVTEWLNTNTAPFPPKKVRTPDYQDPRLREAIKAFIAAMGAKYDGDPRIGYITAGIIGTWGEWHTYPRDDLMASKEVQSEVMDAYESAFKMTPILLRYPAGEDDWSHAPNHQRSFGYHDDSFAWATLDTGRQADSWFFEPALKAAGSQALNKWKVAPIGGEIRPELWGQIFDDRPEHPQAQDFSKCIDTTHVTWLMDTGMFREKQAPARIANAVKQVQRMGYEFYIESVQFQPKNSGGGRLELRVKNTGVAPFYHPWVVKLALINGDKVVRELAVDWKINELLPEQGSRIWSTQLSPNDLEHRQLTLAVSVENPMPGGLPLCFANQYPAGSSGHWWPIPINHTP